MIVASAVGGMGSHLSPAGRGVEWLPPVLVPAADAGPVFQQQLGGFRVAVGSRDVELPKGRGDDATKMSPPT